MKDNKITLEQITAFGAFLTENEKSRATLQKYLRDVGRFVRYAGDRPVDKSLILAYKAELGQNYAVTSANSMLASLNSFLRFAGWQGLCVRQFRLQKKIYCSQEKELSKREYLRLVHAAEQRRNQRLSLVIQSICATGIRVSELQYITVEAVKKGETTVSCKGKTRVVFIVSALRERLLRYARQQGIDSGVIFVTSSGKPLDRSNIWREMKSLCRQAGVSPDKVFPHNLRHLFARTFYAIEKDIAKLADILGHSSINTTRIYIMTTASEHRRRMENMSLLL